MVSINVTQNENSHSLLWYHDFGGSFKGLSRSPLNVLKGRAKKKHAHGSHIHIELSRITTLRLSHHIPVV